jgi:ribonuclease VapC
VTSAVLDASAIIALLRGERGASKVTAVVASAIVDVVNHAEVVSHFANLGAPAHEIREMLTALPYAVVPGDEALAWEAGILQTIASVAGLPLSGRFCLALAKQMNAPVYTADRAWKEIAAAAGVRVVVIR